ncbi:conserved hypothetical protein [Leishmania mexicana MHOM/GT/2001/U1103]|uniref:Uncharacterized protein n=1 Tax=Leishmania mexicana (strain MHOM/GT/2001/U1103) TaxID=929439 RepID=E9B267_LEIMU|nr:conserved hypothetical protein [Leishmania mexicana MHOM/GT/2001/U1103]CBZ29328.1 conserved hypothetical protein [Leishmania mexicana MHOM/GT/2001/U1103]
MSSPSSASPSRASLARVLAEARQGRLSRHASSVQLQRHLLRWFPRGLWSFIYRASSRGGPGIAAKANVYRRFCRNPPRVSHEWTAALQLVELACLVDTMPGTSLSKVHYEAELPASTPTPESDSVVQATEHLLRYGVFPPSGWALTLRLLHMWRARQPGARLQVFPTSLSPPAAAQLLHHISLAPPSQQAWQDALCLYHLCATEVHTPSTNGQPFSTKKIAPPSPPRSTAYTAAHSAFLKALRHMTLTTFLQADEWERGLHFYYHTLYQRDLPGPITTSYLVQQLGRAGQWEAVLQVYELCVKLLHAQRHQREQQQRLSPHEDDWLSRQWGTTLSMAMAAAQNSPSAPTNTLAAMVRHLQPGIGTTSTLSTDVTGAASSSSPPLVRLSGHFLSALQALPSEKDRLAVLDLAWSGSLLDIFKLIRGLISKHKWEEALLLFDEGMRSTAVRTLSPDPRGVGAPAPHASAEPTIRKPPALSRREIGEARLGFLHEVTIDSVTAVVAALNRHRSVTGRRRVGAQREGEGAPRSPSAAEVTSMRLMLNDREVECVLSKTLALREAEHRVLSPAALGTREDFWRYCLEVLAFNYGALPCGDTSAEVSRLPEHANEGHSSPPRSPRRTPTLAALSFLLRHPQLPWHVALRLLRHYGVLETCSNERAAASTGTTDRRAAPPSSVVQKTRTSSAPTPRSLTLAAAVELLRIQGQPQAAEKLALESLDMEMAEKSLGTRAVISLSAALLEVAQYPTLRSVLLEREEERLTVEGSTLFHVLRESTRVRRTQAEGHADDEVHGTSCGTVNSSAPPWWAGSTAFFHHPSGRALTVVWLLMQRRMHPRMATTDAARQDGSESLLASLFLCVPPPPTASVAAAGLAAPLHSWLLAYPVAVHCEVVRVIKCLTSPSAPFISSTSSFPEAGLCYTKRWVWTRRYLASLAAHFSAPCTDTGVRNEEESFVENEPGHAAADAVAREAYYGATFEAVVSLLDTAVPGAPDSHDGVSQRMQMDAFTAATVAGQDEDAPRSSAHRVQQLHQLLERAIVRYGCLPPTHMLLPNQLDRLLPPLPRSRLPATDVRVGEKGSRHDCVDRDGACAERCAVALHLVRLVLGALKDAGAHYSVEPVLLHNLLKLCCRVAEHDQASLTTAKGATDSGVDSSAEVSRAGAMLVQLQCELCGLQTVRPGTLSLLYHLCAAAQSRASSYGHTVPRQVALETTRYLLAAQSAAAARKDQQHQWQEGALPSATSAFTASSSQLQSGQQRLDPLRPLCAVQARHCELFFSLLGWEDALEVWYRAYPHEVLTQLSRNPQAVEACLSLGESSQL